MAAAAAEPKAIRIMNYPTNVKHPRIFDFQAKPDEKSMPAAALKDLTIATLQNYKIAQFGSYVEPITRGIKIALSRNGNKPRKVLVIAATLLAKVDPSDKKKVEFTLFYARWADGKNSESPVISSHDDIDKIVRTNLRRAHNTAVSAEVLGSGWRILGVPFIDVSTLLYNTPRGMGFRELPGVIKKAAHQKRLVNIKNNDELCFLYCIAAHMNPAKSNPSRVQQYKTWLRENPHAINLDGVSWPMKLDKIPAFSKQNPHLPPIIVFGVEEDALHCNADAFYTIQVPEIDQGVEPIGLVYLEPEIPTGTGH